MSRIKFDVRDIYRVLITDLTPYEVPIIFSNQHYYEFAKALDAQNNTPQIISELLKNNNSYYIPYDYKIRKSELKYRTLSLIHPKSLLSFVGFYDKYADLIISLCQRSPVSLRYPNQIASSFYERKFLKKDTNFRDSSVNVDSDKNLTQVQFSSSFFSYKKYDFLYKFYDSYEFHRLEKKFEYMLKFDISKCFYSIYTHSLSWAVKDKKFGKVNRDSESFENIFDKLMRDLNYGETNGIIVGPEVSRIYAEIILQKIDNLAIKSLDNCGYRFDEDYTVRRYVDDYFVFSNSKACLQEVLKCYQKELEYFKLYINESKIDQYAIPFLTGVTSAKVAIRSTLLSLFETFYKKSDNGEDKITLAKIISPGPKSNRTIRDIKIIIKSNDIRYESVSGYMFSIVRKRFLLLLNEVDPDTIKSEQEKQLRNIMYIVFDILFFIYSMDVRVRTTYYLSQIIVAINNFLKKFSPETQDKIRNKISEETTYAMRIFSLKGNPISIEILNLLIALKNMGDGCILKKQQLITTLRLDLKQSGLSKYITIQELDYFQLVVLLYFVGKVKEYDEIRSAIEKEVLNKFKANPEIESDTEQCYLFFDILSCPFISAEAKKNIIKIVSEYLNINDISEHNRAFEYISERNWFINWQADLQLYNLLEKKELRAPYSNDI